MEKDAGFSWAAALIGALVMLVLLIVAAAIYISSGAFPVGANEPYPPGMKAIVMKARMKAVDRSASGLNPPQMDAAAVREGGSHFKGMCQECHGGPGTKPEGFATAMDPTPPDLGKAGSKLSVAEIYWAAKNGIKMSAMPAFGKVDEDEELWKIAAFVKTLPKVSASDYAAIPKSSEEGEGGGSGEAGTKQHAAESGDND